MALSTTQYGYIIDPMVPFTDDKGKTIKNGFVRVFVAGSSTPVVTYRNFDGATNQDRIELDNSGRTKTSVIGSKGLTYKVCVYDKHHSQESPILTVDKVSAIGANITAGSGATVVTGLDGLTTKPDGFVDASVVGTDGFVALDHTLVTDDLNTDAKVDAVENDRYIPLLNEDVNAPDSKMTLGRLWQWVLGHIKSLSTSITAFRTGDVIPVDGPSGTAKMGKDDLLNVTAQNALAGNVAPLFDQTRTSETAYKAGDRVLGDDNKIYVFKTSHYGVWNALDVVQIESNDTTFEIFDISSTNGCTQEKFVNNPTIGTPPRFGSAGNNWNLVCTKLYKGESIYLDYRYVMIGAATKYIVIVNEATGLVTGMVEITGGITKYTATEDSIILFTIHYDSGNIRSAFAIISRHTDEEKLRITTAKYRINAPADNDNKYLFNGTIGGNITMYGNTGYAVAEETLDVGDQLMVYYGGSNVGVVADQVQVLYDGSAVIDEIVTLQNSVTTYTATRPCKVYFSLHSGNDILAYYTITKLSISSALTGLYNSASKSEVKPSIVCPKFIDVVDGVQNKNVIFPFDMLTSGNGLDGGYMVLKRSGSNYPLRVWDRRPYDFDLLTDTVSAKFIQNNVVIAQKTFSTRLVSGNSQPADTTAKICICGDSLIDNNYAASQAYKLLLADGYTIRQVGTKSIIYDGVTYKHEGHSGWKYADYIDVNKAGNPFVYNGAIDFKHYAESLLSDLPAEERVLDYFLVSLGTNDVGGGRAAGLLTDAAIAGLINNVKAFIDYLKDVSVGFPSCKVAIGLPGLGALATNPVFGENIQKFNQALIDTFDDGSYASGVTCVCHGPYIYREESYQYTDTTINGYCSDTYRKPGDGIHPRDIGYQQWGFAYYAKLKSMLNGNL